MFHVPFYITLLNKAIYIYIYIYTSRGENQKGVSDMFGEMEIYVSNESSSWALSAGKSNVIHKCTDIYYKQ